MPTFNFFKLKPASFFARVWHLDRIAGSDDVPYETMVGAAIVLGLFLYGISTHDMGQPWQRRWLFTAWAAAGAGVGFFIMTARRGSQALTAALGLVLAVVVGAIVANVWPMAALADNSANAPHLLVPALTACALLWAMCTSWANAWLDWQTGQKTQNLSRIYPHLFQNAWSLWSILGYVAIFTWIVWAVLGLTAALFHVLGLRFVKDALLHPFVIFTLTAALVGHGTAVMRAQAEPVAQKLRIVLALARSLTPLLAAAIVLVAAATVMRGVELLWRTGHSAVLLVALQVFMVVFINGVYQDGEKSTLETKSYKKQLHFSFMWH